MGWKGALRTYAAIKRREIRAERRELREREKAAKDDIHRQRQEVSQQLVDRYELQLRLLTTVHHECGNRVDWNEIAIGSPPTLPEPVTRRTREAESAIAAYRPGIFTRLFGAAAEKRLELETALATARRDDEAETQALLAGHEAACKEAEEMRAVARGVLTRDASYYVEALARLDAFEELEERAAIESVSAPHANAVVVSVLIPTSEQVIPDEAMSLTQRGLVSTRKLAKTKGNELYQDCACGAALRACREVFAALPVEWVIASVRTELLDKSTGHMKPTAIVSVCAPRDTIESLAFERLDPSDAMSNFLHRMGFKKSAGLSPIDELTTGDIPAGAAEPYR